jgi:hypothetical protein
LGIPVVSGQRPDGAAFEEVFGSRPAPSSSDERDPADEIEATDRDAWLRDNVPPHHI